MIREEKEKQKRQKNERLAEIREAENSNKETALMNFSIFVVQTFWKAYTDIASP